MPVNIVSILDQYTAKYHYIELPDSEKLNFEDMIIFTYKSGEKTITSLGLVIGSMMPGIDKKADYSRLYTPEELAIYHKKQQEAQEKFPLFKNKFRQYFPSSIPITAKYHVFSGLWYFYFYSEERYDFTDFIKAFREELDTPFFFYQLNARDMLRLDPRADNMLNDYGLPLEEKSYRPLADVTMDDIYLQHLEGRDLEKLKGFHGRFKPSLAYEVETYRIESQLFPPKGSKIQWNNEQAIVKNFNIMTRMIDLQLDEDRRAQIHLDERQKMTR